MDNAAHAGAIPTTSSVEVTLPSILISVSLQFDPQNLRDFLLELHRRFGALGTGLQPTDFLLQRGHSCRQRVLLLLGRAALLIKKFSAAPLLAPEAQVGSVESLPPQQRANLPRLTVGVRFPQDLELVLR